MRKFLYVLSLLIFFASSSFSQTWIQNHPEELQTWNKTGVKGGTPDSYNYYISIEHPRYEGMSFTDKLQEAIKDAHKEASDRSEIVAVTIPENPSNPYILENNVNLKDSVVVKGAGSETTVINISPNFLSNSEDTSAVFTIFGENEYRSIGNSNKTYINKSVDYHSKTIETYFYDDYESGDYLILASEVSGSINGSMEERNLGAIFKVESVDYMNLTLANETSRNWDISNNPYTIKMKNPIEYAGIEDLTIVNPGDESEGAHSIIYMLSAVNCWVKGVHTSLPNRRHIRMENTAFSTIRGNWMDRAGDYDGENGAGYGVWLSLRSTRNLIIDNYLEKLRHHICIAKYANTNSVVYNKAEVAYETEWRPDPTIGEGYMGDIQIHGNYPWSNLIEGNEVENILADDYHYHNNGASNQWAKNGPLNYIYRNSIFQTIYDDLELGVLIGVFIHGADYTRAIGNSGHVGDEPADGVKEAAIDYFNADGLYGGSDNVVHYFGHEVEDPDAANPTYTTLTWDNWELYYPEGIEYTMLPNASLYFESKQDANSWSQYDEYSSYPAMPSGANGHPLYNASVFDGAPGRGYDYPPNGVTPVLARTIYSDYYNYTDPITINNGGSVTNSSPALTGQLNITLDDGISQIDNSDVTLYLNGQQISTSEEIEKLEHDLSYSIKNPTKYAFDYWNGEAYSGKYFEDTYTFDFTGEDENHTVELEMQHKGYNGLSALESRNQDKIVKTESGYIYRVYEESESIWLEKSTDGGSSWEMITRVNNPSNTAKYPSIDSSPSILVDNGVVITYKQTTDNNIIIASYTNAGGLKRKTVDILDSFTIYDNVECKPGIVYTFDKTILIYWIEKRISSGERKAVYAISSLDGTSNTFDHSSLSFAKGEFPWQSDDILEMHLDATKNATTGTGHPEFHVLWTYGSGDYGELRYFRLADFSDGDGTDIRETGPKTIASVAGGYKAKYPKISVSSNNMPHASWISEDNDQVIYTMKVNNSWSDYYFEADGGYYPVTKAVNGAEYDISGSNESGMVFWDTSIGPSDIPNEQNQTYVSDGFYHDTKTVNNGIANNMFSYSAKDLSGINVMYSMNQEKILTLEDDNLTDQRDRAGYMYKNDKATRKHSKVINVVVDSSVDYQYEFGGVEVDEEQIMFEEDTSITEINSTGDIENILTTKPFSIDGSSNILLSNSGRIISMQDSTALKNDVEFTIKLVNSSGEAVGEYPSTIIDSVNQQDNSYYSVDCSGLNAGTYHLTVKADVSDSSDIFVGNKTYLEGNIDKKKYIDINYTGEDVPSKFVLHNNYPNPFNPTTNIKYMLPEKSHVTLKVYDILGREVETLVNKVNPQGEHEVKFNAEKLSSGVYIYKLSADDYSSIKKMTLVK